MTAQVHTSFRERIPHYWKIFFGYVGMELPIYILISFIATLTESLGIGLFFPLLSAFQGDAPNASTARYSEWINYALQSLGLSPKLGTLLACFVVVFLCKALIQLMAGAYQAKIAVDFLKTVSIRLNTAITQLRYRSFLDRNQGVLSNTLVTEASNAMVAFSKYSSLFPPTISILVFTILALRLDWQVAVVAILFGSCAMFGLRSLAQHARRFSYERTNLYGVLSGQVWQELGAFKYLVSTEGFHPLRTKITETISAISRAQFYLSTLSVSTQVMNEPVVILFLAGMLWRKTMLGGEPFSIVMVLCILYFRLIRELMNFQNGWQAFSATMGSIDIVEATIRSCENNIESFSGATPPSLRQEIRFQDVSFSYGGANVLSNVSFTIPSKKFTAFVGESGSGKTTAVDLLTGILRPSQGEIFLDDLAYSSLNLRELRHKIGFVSQDPPVFNDTVLNNISFWSSSETDERVRARAKDAAEQANAWSFISKLSLAENTILGERGISLSGGQRQRIAIARELFKKAELLILDEATSALDSETESEIQRSIESLRGKVTAVVIAHRLSTIRNADLIYVFAEGKIVESGTFTALYEKNSYFRKFCNLQGL